MNEGVAVNKANMKFNHLPRSGKHVSRWDFILWLLVIFLVGGGIGVTYYYPTLLAPIKLVVWVVILLLSAGLISRTARGETIVEFGKKARIELRKVIWPTRQATIQATAVVGVIVVIMSLMLWMIDSGLVWLASLATGQRG